MEEKEKVQTPKDEGGEITSTEKQKSKGTVET